MTTANAGTVGMLALSLLFLLPLGAHAQTECPDGDVRYNVVERRYDYGGLCLPNMFCVWVSVDEDNEWVIWRVRDGCSVQAVCVETDSGPVALESLPYDSYPVPGTRSITWWGQCEAPGEIVPNFLPYTSFMPLSLKPSTQWKGVVQAQGNGLEGLNASWFYNYQPWNGWEEAGWVPLVRPMHCDEESELDTLAALAAEHPGREWLIFNEPDLQSQDDITPERGAQLYDALYAAVKGADPSARLFCCGTSFSNTAWLDAFLHQVGAPLDGVHFHGYPCRSGDSQQCEDNYWPFHDRYDMDLATAKMDGFHQYCQGHEKLSGLPIWLTEFGILSNTDWDTRRDALVGVMGPFVLYLSEGGGLDKFERVAWFSDRYSRLDASDLTLEDGSLTVLGEAWNGAGGR